MTERHLILLVELALYLGATFYLGYRGWKAQGTGLTEFFVAGRGIGGIIGFLTWSATLFSAFTLVGLPGFFYTHGIGSWVFIAFADTYMGVMFYLIGRRLWRLSRQFDFITPTELLGYRFASPGLSILAVTVSTLFLLPYIAIQMIGVGRLLEGATGGGIPYLWGSFLLLLVVLIYSEMGGMRAVAWTDALQGILFFLLFYVVVAFFVGREWGGIGPMFRQVAEAKPALLSAPGPTGYFTYGTLVSLFLFIIGMPLTQPQLAVRYFIPRSERSLRIMTVASSTFATLIVIPALLIGLGGAVTFPNLRSGDLLLSEVLTRYVPPLLAGLVICAVIAAAMSTVDSQILVLGSLFAKDIYSNLSLRERTEGEKMRAARIAICACMAAAFLLSIRPVPLLVQLAILSFAGTFQLAPAYLAALFWPRATRAGAVASIPVGIAVLLLGQWVLPQAWLGLHPGVWGFLLGLLTLIGVSLLTRPTPEEAERGAAFLHCLDKESHRRRGGK